MPRPRRRALPIRSWEQSPVVRDLVDLGRRAAEAVGNGRSLIGHLADPDWKPSTATPESCRWEYEPAPTNFWGHQLGFRFRF